MTATTPRPQVEAVRDRSSHPNVDALDLYISRESTMTPAEYSAFCKQVGVIQEMRLRTTHRGDLDGAFAAAVLDVAS